MVAMAAESAPQRGALRQTITNLLQLQKELPSWMGQDFAVDLETTGLDYTQDRIVGIAFTFAEIGSFYVVLEHTIPVSQRIGIAPEQTDYLPKVFCPRAEVIRLLQPLFAQEDVTILAHNAKFELHFLTKAGLEISSQIVDTMLAAQILDENRSVGLKQLADSVGMKLTEYAELVHYPGFGKKEILGVPLDLCADYAMDDTETTWRLWEQLQPQLEAEDVVDPYYTIWMPLLPVLQEMEARGIAMDIERVKQARDHYVEVARDAEIAIWREGMQMVLSRFTTFEEVPKQYLIPLKEISESYEEWTPNAPGIIVRGVSLPVWRKLNQDGSESKAFLPKTLWFNPGSGPQLRDLLVNYLGLTLEGEIAPNFTKGGEVSIDKDTLKILRYEMASEAPPVLDALLTYRKASKLLSTYLKVYLEKTDARDHFCLRTSFNQAATDTGRLSSSKPNLQNQPARGEEGRLVRSLFVARPGHSLVVADYSMMELRVAANLSRDPAMINAFQNDLDLHGWTAAGQQGVDYADFMERYEAGDPDAKRHRYIGKTSNFGLLYGMGAVKFQRLLLVDAGVKVSLQESEQLIEDFRTTYPVLRQWKMGVMRYIGRTGYITTLSGRKRRLPEAFSDVEWMKNRAMRMGVNAYVQGSCADIINKAIPAIQDYFRYLGGSLLLQVHDELVGEVPTDAAPTAARIMSKLMVEEANAEFQVPLVAEAGIGPNWGAAK
jgi:DNA polymerase I-like protein with 3'-5' exonuclease and polymerase domains